MTATRINMHRLQEATRLHRLGNSQRAIASKLKMGRETVRAYLAALGAAFLLEGSPDDLPDAALLKKAIEHELPSKPVRQQTSKVEAWRTEIEGLHRRGAGPKSIHDYLRLHVADFDGSLSAVKRFCRQLAKAKGPNPKDVTIPVVTLPGEVSQWRRGSTHTSTRSSSSAACRLSWFQTT